MKPEELSVLKDAHSRLKSATLYIDHRTWLRPQIDKTILDIDALLEPLRPICPCCKSKGAPTINVPGDGK